ncbi:hypothetical protein M493_08975 [Geobacillus genomosp. 3]|uniref:Uncharacterized protein n=1 Tax=Geobacillus genomosp. 3 TaxID=1921421 RepID=S5ZNP2_GEOG3|nr:hypothetical protein [Geobacillus genomosp. 3]AGT32068.1 hypothetical protein M493_08975 [Geobacillus genomosp. 3]
MSIHGYWNAIDDSRSKLHDLLQSYWNDYSNVGTWQFWLIVVFLVAPVLLLVFTVDRRRILEVFFFGYTVHILWTYAYIALENAMYLSPRYFLTPFLPFALNITASVLPVGFLLLYQYCTNRNKNFYAYTLLLSAVFAFGLASLEQWLGLLDLHRGLHKFHLFLIDLAIVFIAYGVTRFLVRVQARS